MKIEILINVIIALTSIIINLCIAAYTFVKIDGYVRDVVELAKKSIRDAYLDKGTTQRS